MNRFDDLSIATTAHNNAATSVAMLQSFAENVGAIAEVVVVDDASSTPFHPLEIPGLPIRVVRNSDALGFCKASDRALREVRTPFALLVDADVLFQPGDFAGGFAEFRVAKWAWANFAQVSFAGTPQQAFEQPLMPPWVFAAGNQVYSLWEKFHPPVLSPAAGQRICDVQAAHSSCTLVNMEAFHAIGGFDPWYAQCQSDVEISLRFREQGYRVGVDLGYEVKHDGAGGRNGSLARVLDLYRARLHLYERAFPQSRWYLRLLLFIRHLFELLFFSVSRPFTRDGLKLRSRVEMIKAVFRGYE